MKAKELEKSGEGTFVYVKGIKEPFYSEGLFPAKVKGNRLYFNGKLVDRPEKEGPALIPDKGNNYMYATIDYLKDGKLHRVNGPARKFIRGGKKEWFVNGIHHRLDGPAVESKDTIEYYINGVLHREDGPAAITKDKIKYAVNGVVHRDPNEGPAVCHKDGTEEYWVNGKLHREDGPAIVKPNGDQKWFYHGLRHRLDGPAEIENGWEEYWIDDKLYTTEKGWEKAKKAYKLKHG